MYSTAHNVPAVYITVLHPVFLPPSSFVHFLLFAFSFVTDSDTQQKSSVAVLKLDKRQSALLCSQLMNRVSSRGRCSRPPAHWGQRSPGSLYSDRQLIGPRADHSHRKLVVLFLTFIFSLFVREVLAKMAARRSKLTAWSPQSTQIWNIIIINNWEKTTETFSLDTDMMLQRQTVWKPLHHLVIH